MEILQEELQNAGGYVFRQNSPLFTHLKCAPFCLPSVSYMYAGHDLRQLRKERDSLKFSQMSVPPPPIQLTHRSKYSFCFLNTMFLFLLTHVSSPKGHLRESVKDVGVSTVSDLIILLTLLLSYFQQSELKCAEELERITASKTNLAERWVWIMAECWSIVETTPCLFSFVNRLIAAEGEKRRLTDKNR